MKKKIAGWLNRNLGSIGGVTFLNACLVGGWKAYEVGGLENSMIFILIAILGFRSFWMSI